MLGGCTCAGHYQGMRKGGTRERMEELRRKGRGRRSGLGGTCGVRLLAEPGQISQRGERSALHLHQQKGKQKTCRVNFISVSLGLGANRGIEIGETTGGGGQGPERGGGVTRERNRDDAVDRGHEIVAGEAVLENGELGVVRGQRSVGDDGDLARGTDEGAGLVNGSERVAPHLEIEGEDERLTLNHFILYNHSHCYPCLYL